MTIGLAALAFTGALAATLGASELLVWGLSRLGLRLGLSAGLLGLLVALGADSPEIASATSAMLSGAREVGVGVILGSNLFNLAALLGLPALIRGRLPVRRALTVADGSTSMLVLLVAAGLLSGRLAPPAAVAFFALILAVYSTLLALPARSIAGGRWLRLISEAWSRLSAQIHSEQIVPDRMRGGGGWLPVAGLPAALAVIVAGSIVMVMSAVLLGERWHLPSVIVGTVALASVTGLPNLYAAVRLTLRGEGATVVSEAFNSNTLNVVAGFGLPALVLGTNPSVSGASSSLVWLGGLSLLAVLVTSLQAGLSRLGGTAIILGYGVFLACLIRAAAP